MLLYNVAAMLVLPSKGEGFGLPVVEAMACGLPVAASNRNSLPEVLDGAGCCSSRLGRGNRRHILRLLREPHLRADLRARGWVRAQAYSWDRARYDGARTRRGRASMTRSVKRSRHIDAMDAQ